MTPTVLSDAELARRCRYGDPAAWRQLVRRVSPLVYRIAVRVLGRGPDAEDVGQEVLMSVHRSFATYDASRPLAPWVARMAYNAALKQLARRQKPGGAAHGIEQLARLPDAGRPSPEQLAANAEAGARVDAALSRLTPEDRVLVTLTYQDGLSNAEVARAMDLPVGTVKTRLSRARGRLRKALAPILRRGTER